MQRLEIPQLVTNENEAILRVQDKGILLKERARLNCHKGFKFSFEKQAYK